MTTWFIVAFFGVIGATVGPVNMTTCKAMVDAASQDMDFKFATMQPEDIPPVAGRTVQRNDVNVACYVSPTRPRIGERIETN